MSNRQDDALPELPESGMSEANPYLYLGPMDPHGGKQILHWYDADQMRAYAQSAIASLQARLDAAEKDAGWIAVADRLPEPDSGEVLVWLTGGRCALDEWHMHREDPTGMGGPTMEMGYMWRDYDFEEITHWRPLPAAPEA